MAFYNHFMDRRILQTSVLLLWAVFGFTSYSTSYAQIELKPSAASPYELIAAVNSLRAVYGLPPYSISSILMSTAQNQADYMAASGSVSHTGAGDLSVTDRLLAAGYPLAGQLSLGGFRSENITAGNENMSAQAAVDQWKGDSVHLTTMISPDLTEIGAGISVKDGRAYFVIDCARPTDSGIPQTIGTSVAGEPTVGAGGAGVVIPVTISTPDTNGDVIHEVRAGQTLWQIAIAYNTKIDEIKRLNGLSGDEIYPGTKLLIQKAVALTPILADIPTGVEETLVSTSVPTAIVVSNISGAPRTISAVASTRTMIASVVGIFLIALICGWLFAVLGNSKK